MLTLFWPERASYKSCEVLDTTIRKLISRSSVLDGSQPILDDLRVLYKGSKVGFYIIAPCFAMNEHPIARMELILRQVEAPVKIYNSKWVPASNYSIKCSIIAGQWSTMKKMAKK